MMKATSTIQKNKLLSFVILIYLILLIVRPDVAMLALGNSGYYFKEMIMVLPVIFLLTVVIEAWIPKEVIMKGIGKKSGFKGYLLALALGSVSAGPIYAAFPIAKTLLKKGASISNVVIILSAWAVVKVPMLANEVKFLGVEFMVTRWILTVLAIFVMAFVVGKIVKEDEVSVFESKAFKLVSGACIGCNICVQNIPELFEMKGAKAVIISSDQLYSYHDRLVHVTEKCPSRAIVYEH